MKIACSPSKTVIAMGLRCLPSFGIVDEKGDRNHEDGHLDGLGHFCFDDLDRHHPARRRRERLSARPRQGTFPDRAPETPATQGSRPRRQGRPALLRQRIFNGFPPTRKSAHRPTPYRMGHLDA